MAKTHISRILSNFPLISSTLCQKASILCFDDCLDRVLEPLFLPNLACSNTVYVDGMRDDFLGTSLCACVIYVCLHICCFATQTTHDSGFVSVSSGYRCIFIYRMYLRVLSLYMFESSILNLHLCPSSVCPFVCSCVSSYFFIFLFILLLTYSNSLCVPYTYLCIWM